MRCACSDGAGGDYHRVTSPSPRLVVTKLNSNLCTFYSVTGPKPERLAFAPVIITQNTWTRCALC